MATDGVAPEIALIGEAAGAVWQVLDAQGPITLSKLLKVVDQPRDVVMQALGWLAREDKITIQGNPRNRSIALK